MDDARLVYGTDAQVQQTLDVLRALGVDRVRVSVFWKLLAPRPDDTTRPSFSRRPLRLSLRQLGPLRSHRGRGAAPRDRSVLHVDRPGALWASSDPSRGERMWDPNAFGLPRLRDRRRPPLTARVRRGRPLRAFGQLRPAANGAHLRADLQFKRRGSWRVVRRLSTSNFRNYLVAHVRARASGSWRLAWRTSSATLYSRSVKVRRR